ncbi:MAG: hypothetical protein K5656_09585 [Lachnospiraceae bacterium]|nr:hypothetical protein [Lachnospiraceae bacterium]
MDSRKRKEKLLNQINKDKKSSKKVSYKSSKSIDIPVKVDNVSKASNSKKAKEAKPAFSNDEALKNRISKEKSAYNKSKDAKNATGVSRLMIRTKNKWNAKSDQEKYKFIGAWVVVILLAVIVVALLINGISSNKNKSDTKLANKNEAVTEETASDSTEEEAASEDAKEDLNPLVISTDDRVNELVNKYLTALRDNDLDALKALDKYQDAYESGSTYKNLAGVIEDYTNITTYVKKGPYEGGFVAYIVTDIKFKGIEHTCQGMYRYVIVKDGDDYYIDTTPEDDIEDDDISTELTNISMSYDVLDLYDSVNKQAQADMEEDEDLKTFVNEKLKGKGVSPAN